MKAIVIHAYGGPEVLSFEDVPDPTPGPGEVVVEVHAVSIQRVLDVEVRKGTQGRRGVKLPLIPGVDPAGIVVAVGDKVPGIRPRTPVVVSHHVACGECAACLAGEPARCTVDAMLGIHRWGGDAQYVRVPYTSVTPIPEGLDFTTAIIVSRHAGTAYKLLVRAAKLRKGETVLIMGAAGNLGAMGIQIAKNMIGATVIATAGSATRAQTGLDMGADVAIDYSREDLREAVMAATGGRGVDVVYDNIANPETLPKAIDAMKKGGRLVTAGAHGGPIVPVDFGQVYHKNLTIVGVTGFHEEDYPAIFRAAAEGKLRGHYERIMPLREAAEAHRLIEADPGLGKIILDPTL